MSDRAIDVTVADNDLFVDALQVMLETRFATPRHALEEAVALVAETSSDFARVLLRLGVVSERQLADALARVLDLSLVTVEDFPTTPMALHDVSVQFLRDHGVLPLERSDTAVRVAMVCPHETFTRDALQLAFRQPIDAVVGVASEIAAQLSEWYDTDDGAEDLLTDLSAEGTHGVDIAQLKDLASEAPVVRYVSDLFSRAIDARASDIHLEPFERALRVRLRVDGQLQPIASPPTGSAPAVLSRLKLLAQMNIAERRLPQDGRIMSRIQGKAIDMRVSTIPTVHGETVVLRLLDKTAVPLAFDELGFETAQVNSIRACIEQPHGIFLVTGPTGSGKTTTLYTALSELNRIERNIVTVEDPVEYQLHGISQMQVHPAIDLTFASALRAIMRQDPDVIMIGEMRDLETAQVAVQSALTGHLVLSTLHTNDAAGSVTRLLDMGVAPYLVTSTVIGVLAQRLARRLCVACRRFIAPLPTFLEALSVQSPLSPEQYAEAVGCRQCQQTGWLGRVVIAELLRLSDALRQLILQQADSSTIQQQAEAGGMTPMAMDGNMKAAQGITTLDEILRLTHTDA